MANNKQLEKQLREAQEQAARLMRERDHLRELAKETEGQKPMFFTKMFNEMDKNTKSILIRDCEDIISETFIHMSQNLKDSNPTMWELQVARLCDRLEKFVLDTSGKNWTIRKSGTVAGAIDFKCSGSPNKQSLDFIDVTWAHLGYKRPRMVAKELSTEERIQESPTPEPVAVKMHTRIFRRDF